MHLVTTADERTWRSQRPLLFLGEWCRRWDRRHVWQGLDATVAAPYGLGQHNKDADHAFVRELERKLFPLLCDVLGRWHGVTTDQRYWQIILGHWFRRYIEVIFNRVRTLQSCFSQNQVVSTTVLERSGYQLATQDSYSAIWAFNDDRWNHVLYLRLMQHMSEVSIEYETVEDRSSDVGFVFSSSKPAGWKERLAFGLRNTLDKGLGLLGRDSAVFILNSYLPRKEEIKLQLALGQIPRLPISPSSLVGVGPDPALRDRLSRQMAPSTGSSTEDLARSLLFQLIPVCYLENFSLIKKTSQKLSWPRSPRAVLTSNNFDTDEVFKSWVADKVLNGTLYLIGQHGNNYGTHRHHFNPSVEELVSDRFLTWGWHDGLPQHQPAMLLKTVGRQAIRCLPTGELLLIASVLPHRLNTWDGVAEFKDYFKDQQRFVGSLGEDAVKRLRIRLHHSHAQMGWGEMHRWKAFNPELQVDGGHCSINKLIDTCRLVVHSYDSTGILETLSLNVPTIAFWQNGLEHVRDSARPWYQLLIDAGIVHLTAESAAVHINTIWDDVGTWWNSAKVQEARVVFCSRYARTSTLALQELKSLIRFDQ